MSAPRRRRAGAGRWAAAAIAAALLGGCNAGGSTGPSAPASAPVGTVVRTAEGTTAPGLGTRQEVTPLLARVADPPVPFAGSDGRTHLVYELSVTNAGRSTATVDDVTVVDADTGASLLELSGAELAERLELLSSTPSGGRLAPAQAATLFVHVAIDQGGSVPRAVRHRVRASAGDGSAGAIDETVGEVAVDRRPVPDLGPPLAGAGYLAADACCDAHRHRRAALPVDGELHLAQRYAIDWEQVDDTGRIYAGDRADPRSYAIYGDPALAMGDATVVTVVDGLPEQTPGRAPATISLDDADGNSVVLDLGEGRYAMYAHLQPGSVRVAAGDRVRRGDVLGLVGNSGNSIAPHLHVQVMDSPRPLASSGLPYTLDRFVTTGQVESTEAFDVAEADGTPAARAAVDPPVTHVDQYPMDRSIVTFGSP